MARAKNTSRAEARRRARVAQRQERVGAEEAFSEEEATEQAPVQRQPLFRTPRFREDLRLLPEILTSRKLLVIPPLILIVGALLFAWLVYTPVGEPTEGMSPRSLADLYIQLLFLPPALLTYFIAGFLVQRASYLVGFLLGLMASGLWLIIIFGIGYVYTPEGAVALTDEEKGVLAVQYSFVSILWGTFGAAFAAWYRDFLRRMQEQGRARRAERESQDRARRREQRHEDRRSLKRASR